MLICDTMSTAQQRNRLAARVARLLEETDEDGLAYVVSELAETMVYFPQLRGLEQHLAEARRRLRLWGFERGCDMCGHLMTTHRLDHRYCSPRCRQRARRAGLSTPRQPRAPAAAEERARDYRALEVIAMWDGLRASGKTEITRQDVFEALEARGLHS